MSTKSFGIRDGGKEDDRVAAELNVFFELISLFGSQARIFRIERNNFVFMKWNRKVSGNSHLDILQQINRCNIFPQPDCVDVCLPASGDLSDFS